MATDKARRAWLSLNYIKQNSKSNARTPKILSDYIEDFEYVDVATGESDTISVTFANVDMRWMNGWMPRKGDKLIAKIILRSWLTLNKKTQFTCGKFTLDDITFSGPTLTCQIGGTSVPETNSFRSTLRNKTWKKITIKTLASGIAKRYHMSLHYEAKIIKIKKVEQSNESDCSLLNKVCEDYGLGIKVYAGKIIIYDKITYESKKAVTTLYAKDLISWSYNSTLVGTYTGAIIKYNPPGKKKKKISYKVGSGKRILKINETIDNIADAELKARAKIHKENEKAITMAVTIMANNKINATDNIYIKGLKRLDGKYFVDQVTHNISNSGYTMSLELHKCQQNKSTSSSSNNSVKHSTSSSSSTSCFTVGDRVVVNGSVYNNGNGGSCNSLKNKEMFIVEVLSNSYKYKYGVAVRKGGTRYGWCALSSLKRGG